jgi:hypothetical protein
MGVATEAVEATTLDRWLEKLYSRAAYLPQREVYPLGWRVTVGESD